MKGVKKKQQAFIFRIQSTGEHLPISYLQARSLTRSELEIEAADRPTNSSTPFHLQRAHAGWLTGYSLSHTHTQA